MFVYKNSYKNKKAIKIFQSASIKKWEHKETVKVEARSERTDVAILK